MYVTYCKGKEKKQRREMPIAMCFNVVQDVCDCCGEIVPMVGLLNVGMRVGPVFYCEHCQAAPWTREEYYRTRPDVH